MMMKSEIYQYIAVHCNAMDGVFSFILLDTRVSKQNQHIGAVYCYGLMNSSLLAIARYI